MSDSASPSRPHGESSHERIAEDIVERRGHLHGREETGHETILRVTQARDQLLALMGSDIRPPMSNLIGLTGLLLDTQLDATQRAYVEEIRHTGKKLLTAINSALDLSQIEADRIELENEPFELMICIDAVIDLIRHKVVEKGLELHCEVAGQIPSLLLGDATRLRQIFLSLLSNAVQSTKAGEVAVSVSVTPREGKRYELHFSVSDTGVRIPPDRRPSLAHPENRDAPSPMQKAESGLGLASSRRLAERMGGTMWVESSGVIGQVATFHFTVVVAEAEDQSFRDMLKEGLDCLRNKRALIVDENPARDRVITSQVAVWEMESVATTSITKAMLQLAEAPRFDIVIVDLPKSPTDRTSPAGKFLAMATAEDIPIVMLTSRLEISRHSGVAVQLVKPVSRQRLCNALCSLLASRAHRRAHPAWREQAESTPAPEPHLRILLADDSPVNQKIGQMMLAKLGCRADLACNGHEAMEAAIRIPYDVILMDCQMPQMNGYEATRRIRQMETSKHHSAAYIIAMTGMEGDRDKCLAAGMNDYLTKPVRPPELQEALDRFEAMQRPRESTAREPLLHV